MKASARARVYAVVPCQRIQTEPYLVSELNETWSIFNEDSLVALEEHFHCFQIYLKELSWTLLQHRWIEAPQIDGDFSNTSNAHTIASHKPPTSTGGSRVKGAEPIKIKNTSALVLPLRRLPPGTHLCLWGEMCPENLGWWKEGGWTERNGVTWGVRANKKCLRSDALEARGLLTQTFVLAVGKQT